MAPCLDCHEQLVADEWEGFAATTGGAGIVDGVAVQMHASIGGIKGSDGL